MQPFAFRQLRFLLALLASAPSILFLYSPALVALTLASVATPFATGRFIDAIAYGTPPLRPFALLAALLLAKALVSPLLQRFVTARSRALETDLQFRVLDATMDLEPSELATTDSGRIVAKLTRDAAAVSGFARGLFPRLLQTAVMMLAAGCALFDRSPSLALAFVVCVPLTILAFSPFARRFAENAHRTRIQGDTSFSSIFDFLFALPLLRTLDAERRFADEPRSALRSLKENNLENDLLSIRFGFLLGLLLVGGEITVLGIAGSLAARGDIPVGDVVLYQMLFLTVLQSVQGVLALLPELSALREGIGSLEEALRPQPRTRRRGALAPLETLAFEHVTFAYPQTPRQPVVRDFSATFRVGTVVGLSGANGAGKSTLLKLAVGALKPQSGDIRFNGIPLGDLNRSLFRLRLGIVFQDNLLVSGTIRDNITLRDPVFTADDLDRALAQSGFDAVVRRLPDGLDTRVGNCLRTLSGGERQRLALARAIIRNPQILVLDEATNHLDAEARKTVAELIARLRPGRLILLAGHDPELDRLYDLKIPCQIPENDSYVRV